MRIALTGTPGTGKTAMARLLREAGENVVDLNDVAASFGFLGPYDHRQRTREVDLDALARHLARTLPKKGTVFLEGHYAHLLPVDRAVVLRCAPATLRRRLSRRGYTRSKVRENSLAEALDGITIEAVAKLGRSRVYEIDTTKSNAKTSTAIVRRLARSGFRRAKKYRPGRIDFSDDIVRHPEYYTRSVGDKAP
jgi:adenylate kinase